MTPVRLASLALPLLLALPVSAELAATFELGSTKDTRIDRLPALLVKAGESATPFLAPGAFTTTWSGKLTVPKRLKIQFSFEGEGSVVMTVDGKEVLKEEGTLGTAKSPADRLAAGDHEVTIVYKSKADGGGRFRLFWEAEGNFPRQTIPASAFQTDVKADAAHDGRFLFAANNCSKCHISTAVSMTELNEIRPLLFSTGSRLNEKWIAEWIADPASLKPDTRMPKLVDASTAEGKQKAADIAAFLVTNFKMGEVPPAPDKSLAEKGGANFHRFGCIACHTAPDKPGFDTENGRIPLSNVSDKFLPGALAGFLKKPEALYPHIGMPNFHLTDSEAEELSAFLLTTSAKVEKKHPEFPKGDATRGAALAASLNCGSCHAGTAPFDPTAMPTLEAIFKKDWAGASCVTNKAPGKMPQLILSEEDKVALIAFSKKGIEPLQRNNPAESTAHQLKSLHCTNCHSMDGKPSLLEKVHGETKDLTANVHGEHEKIDQSRPQLTYMGEMLHSSYIESMLAGTVKQRPRPWLDMRMPGFPGFAAGIGTGFAHIHGLEPSKPEELPLDKAAADIGKKLITKEDGFGCVTCHAVGSAPATAVFEVEGVNFALSHERLRHEYYTRWMENPPAITPPTKMPRYGDNTGKTQRSDVYDGDAAKQFEAIWNFIQKPE